jgi:hypothetical protein
MSFSPAQDFSALATRGLTEYSITHKFGRNENVGTSFEAISLTGDYQMPTTAQALEIVSTSASDTSAGSGARSVTVQGLDGSFNELTQDVVLNGTTAVAITTDMTRINRAYVKESGTYASITAGSHAGDITIRESGGGASWALLSATDYPRGQSELGAYSVAAGKNAMLRIVTVSVDNNKAANVMLVKREGSDVASAPYDPARIVFELGGITGESILSTVAPFGPFEGPCDLYFLARVTSGTAEVDIDFEIWEY